MRKKKRMLVMLLSALLLLSGCSSKNNSEGNSEKHMVNKMATEEQIQILKDSGLKTREIEEIEENGMSLAVQSYVEVSQKMLSYLEEKYDTSFKIWGGSIPGLLSHSYSMTAYATEGIWEYEKFDITYQTDENGNGYFEDGYFALIRSLEVQEAMQDVADKAGIDARVIVLLDGKVGDGCTKDTTLDEALDMGEYIRIYAFVLTSPKLSDSEFNNAAEKLMKEYEQMGSRMYIDYTMYRLIDDSQLEEAHTYKDIDIVLPDIAVDPEQKFDLRYYKYIKPKSK